MHSAELARLAGVTVRALRHYHQVGVLAEPPRGANGYRDYDVHDLIRVLRIKRLSSLGFALDRMPDLLDGSEGDVTRPLDDLDRELADQIARLTRQRDVIAQLRRHRAAPDLAPELAPFVAMVIGPDATTDDGRWGRDQSVLLAHLVGEDGIARLADFYARLSDPEVAPRATELSERFAQLGPDSAESDIADLLDRFVEVLAAAVGEFATAQPPIDLDAGAHLLTEYGEEHLNAVQIAFLEAFEARLTEAHAAASSTTSGSPAPAG